MTADPVAGGGPVFGGDPVFGGGPVFVGAGSAPALPPDLGALLLTFHFTSRMQRYRSGLLLSNQPNHDHWIPPPKLRVDGAELRASWSTWWYPLAPGPHEVEVAEPAAVRHRLEIVAGEQAKLGYRAAIVVCTDQTGARILRWEATATLRDQRA